MRRLAAAISQTWLGHLARAFAAASRFLASVFKGRSARALGRDAQAPFRPAFVAILSLAFLVLAGAAPASDPASTQSVRFTTIDVRLDPKGSALAAYQIEFVAPPTVKLVGIEGSDVAAYKNPPYYDPAALSRSRVILAAFSTASDLPKTDFSVARLHVQVEGSEQTVDWKVKMIVASTADGTTIPAATATLAEGAPR